MICLADNTVHEDEVDLHTHLRKIKLKQEDYYRKYCTKRDLLTGEEIPWTTREKYLKTDFVNKNNLKKFLKEKPDEGKAWALEWLRRRIAEKGLLYAPTHVELRSLFCPSISYYESIGGYHSICSALGLKPRFEGRLEFCPLPAGVTFIQDSREQSPLRLKENVIIEKLNVGDYALKAPYDPGIYVERKSLSDFVGTLSSKQGEDGSNAKYGFARFRAELERAKAEGAYLVMLVEIGLTDALSFDYLPQMKWATRSTPEHVFRNLRLLMNEFIDFQVLFVAGRKEAAVALVKIFEAGESVKKVDLQLAYDEGKFVCG